MSGNIPKNFIPVGNGVNRYSTSSSAYQGGPRAGLAGPNGAGWQGNTKGQLMFGHQSIQMNMPTGNYSQPKSYQQPAQSSGDSNVSLWPLILGGALSMLTLLTPLLSLIKPKDKNKPEDGTKPSDKNKPEDETKPEDKNKLKDVAKPIDKNKPEDKTKPRQVPDIKADEVKANVELGSIAINPHNRYNIESTVVENGVMTTKASNINNNLTLQAIMMGSNDSTAKFNKVDRNAISSMVNNQFKFDTDGNNTISEDEYVNAFMAHAKEHDAKMQDSQMQDVSKRYQSNLQLLNDQKTEATGKITELEGQTTGLTEGVKVAEGSLKTTIEQLTNLDTQISSIETQLNDPKLTEEQKTTLNNKKTELINSKNELEQKQPELEKAVKDAKTALAQNVADIQGYNEAVSDIETRITDEKLITEQAEADIRATFKGIAGEDEQISKTEYENFVGGLFENQKQNFFDAKQNRNVDGAVMSKQEVMDFVSEKAKNAKNPFGPA